jgi:N-acetylmuramoyl-L-alanine amidase
MCSNSVIFGVSAALLLTCSGLSHTAQAGEVQGAAVVESGGRTQVVIDIPEGSDYGVFDLANPNRLVVDFHNSRFGNRFHLPVPNGVVADVRTGQPVPGDARLVFDLIAKVRPHSYFQNENGHSQLVVELLTGSQVAGSASVVPVAVKASPAVAVSTEQFVPANPASSNPGFDPVVRASDEHGSASPVPAMQGSAVHGAVLQGQSLPGTFQPVPATPADASSGASATRSLAPGNSVVVESLPAALLTTASARQPSASELRRLNPRIDPQVSNVVIMPSPVPPASTHDSADVVAAPEVIQPSRAGARTVRDVLGSGQRKLVIAIDPGHGGKDTGARGYSGTYEKNVTLATARELARQINAEPGMKAVLTRDSDFFVPLAERYAKAREAKADLFISIHADADPSHTATGSSVWVLSQRGEVSQAARWLADRENAADLIGGVSLSDKDDTLASVLLDLSQSATMKASQDAAERVHQSLRDIGRTHKAHPEQANFVVLRSPDVPSMLVETAFITNAEEERHLNDPEYRTRLAGAVLSGVRSYFIDNPLPGTQFTALHDPALRHNRSIAATSDYAPQVNPPSAAAPTYIANSASAAAVATGAIAAAPARMQFASNSNGQQIHVVQPGERLIDIANKFNVPLMKLRDLNDLENNRVSPGQQLLIPMRSGAG